jgi:hypothetical protein
LTTDVATTYEEQRERDWADFTSRSGPTQDYWARWEERSFGWKVPIVFLQPLGLESPSFFEPLQPLLDELGELEEVEVPPVEWLHTRYIEIGFMRPVDILWSQVETFYVNAAPRIHKLEEFPLRIGGISVADDERIYLGVDEGGQYREVRRVVGLGVPKVYERMREDPLITPEGDAFVPTIEIGFLMGRGDRSRVIEALEPYRDIDLGTITPEKLKMARMPIQPHDHYAGIDVVAEIPMYGADARKGYHN